MIDKEKLYETIRINELTVKNIAEQLDVNYQSLLRRIKQSKLMCYEVEYLISKLDFCLYPVHEVFFSDLDKDDFRLVV